MGPRLYFESIESTQRLATSLAREGAEPGTLVVAGTQTHGVGRGDHTWSSPPGGLYLSMLVRSPGDRFPMVPLAVGAELRSRLRARYAIDTMLRWPNDLLVPSGPNGARKLAGVLVDRVVSPQFGAILGVGVGLNVSQERSAFPPELSSSLTTLAELVHPVPGLEEVEALTVAAVEAAVDRVGTEPGARSVVEDVREALYGRGKIARVDGVPAGRIRDVGEDGSLWLEGPSGPETVRAGTVSVEESG